jgi:phage recombination protein Bet
MTTATAEQPTATDQQPAPDQQLQKRKEVLDAVARRGIDEFQWRTLMNSLFPGARSESVLMVIDYCKARKLDPMKKPCHIVPMKVKDQRSGEYEWRDVVMAGIYEYRTTAMRTGNYLGHSKPEYGPMAEVFGVHAPEWCAMTMYRRASNGEKIEFPVCVYFRESCATKFDKETKKDLANDRWSKAPIQMLTKVTEAAGLREAFPDEFGGEATAEEMDGRQSFVDAEVVADKPIQPAQRLSEQQQGKAAPASPSSTTPEPVKAETPAAVITPELEPEATSAPKNIGVIKDVLTKGDAIFVVLDTDYIAGTKDAAMQQSIGKLRDSKQRIELICKAPKSDKFAPIIEEINVVKAPEVATS